MIFNEVNIFSLLNKEHQSQLYHSQKNPYLLYFKCYKLNLSSDCFEIPKSSYNDLINFEIFFTLI